MYAWYCMVTYASMQERMLVDVCTHKRTLCTHIHPRVSVCVAKSECVYVCMCTHIHPRVSVCVAKSECVYVCMYVCMYVCV